MNSIDFCFWLQGHFEISDTKSLSDEQVEVIKNHLNLVFLHEIDPLRESETEASKEQLAEVHKPSEPSSTKPNNGLNNDELVRC